MDSNSYSEASLGVMGADEFEAAASSRPAGARFVIIEASVEAKLAGGGDSLMFVISATFCELPRHRSVVPDPSRNEWSPPR